MSETIVVALISLAGIILSGLISALVASSLIKYRIDQLEKKVDAHNAWGEKFMAQGTDIKLIQQDIKHIKEKLV